MFIKYSTGKIPPKKSRGKMSQDDNIIPELDAALELGKSMSLTEAAKEEAARQVHVTHERILTESNPEPARRRPSGIAFRDTSCVSKKMSPDPSQKLKGIQKLTNEEQLAADTIRALKASRQSSKSQLQTRGSSEGTGTKPGVPDESTITPTTSSEGTGTKPGVPDESTITPTTSSEGTGTKPGVLDEEKVTFKAKADVILDWGLEEESEYYEEGQDDDEETDNEFVHGEEQVNDDEDEETTNAEIGEDDEGITDAEKTESKGELEQAIKLPLTSSSVFVFDTL
ncbi:hypothetical protein Tco_0673406 [Tanacetum coccineum]